eukprot:2842361-Alexandrium_andersonii.AAC.1
MTCCGSAPKRPALPGRRQSSGLPLKGAAAVSRWAPAGAAESDGEGDLLDSADHDAWGKCSGAPRPPGAGPRTGKRAARRTGGRRPSACCATGGGASSGRRAALPRPS